MNIQAGVVEVRELSTRYGAKTVHERIDLTVTRGEILAVVGGSGSGKSTLLREMVGLQRPTAGRIHVLGEEVTRLAGMQMLNLCRRIGVLFQSGALFSGLTVLENAGLPLREHTRLSDPLIDDIAAVKIALTGLEPDVARLSPNELSGGMRKRVALARAIALDPEVLFLDEPTSGLDPVSADAIDELILQLRQSLGLTIVMVTHDIDTLWRTADRVALLGDAQVLGCGTMEELAGAAEPAIQRFFQGPRGRAARGQAWNRS